MSDRDSELVRFGVFEVNLRTGELRKQGVLIKLRTQAFQVLALLLERPGQMLTRDDVQARLWPADTFVDFDRGLNKAVNRLREALGDAADSPRFIETLPKRGYRFIAPVEVERTTDARMITPRPDREPLADVPTTAVERVEEPTPARRRPGVWWLAGAAAIVLIAAGIVSTRRTRLSERDRVVVADFDNRTGDVAFDHTLKQGLALGLEQSPFVSVVSDQEVLSTLRLMHRAADQPITFEVARELCERSGSAAVLAGSVDQLGSEYVLGMQASACRTGETLAREQIRVRRKEEVLDALDQATTHLRRTLGESLSSIERTDRRVHSVLSTSSLDAFDAYTNGERMVLQGRSPIPFFKQAIDRDPDFAYAHAALGLVYGTTGETTLSSDFTRRAYELRDRVSDWETYFITTQYLFQVTGEIEKIPSICQTWIQSYPRDRTAHNRLAFAYRQLGRFESALAEYQQARQLGRDHPIDLHLLATTYMNLNRVDETRAIVRDALSANPDDRRFGLLEHLLRFLQNDRPNAAARDTTIPIDAEDLVYARAESDAFVGRLTNARRLASLAIESARRKELVGRAAVWMANDALRVALVGHADGARRHARSALALASGWDVRALAALALARSGETVQAAGLADALGAEFPVSTLVQHYWVPTIRADVDLFNGHPDRAVESLAAASAYELADTSIAAGPPLYPAYVRGLAFLRARQGPAAAAEFQKVLARRGLVGNHLVGALARLGLARAYTLAGDTANARAQYESFLTLWKGADRETPIIQEAEAEHRAIGGT